MLFRARALLTSYCFLVKELLPIFYLSNMLFSFIFAFKDWAISLALTCLLQRELLFCISILSQYGIEKVFERIEDSLELLLERNNSLSLRVSISMFISILEEVWFKMLVDKALVVVESVLFANSLMGATIQDSSKRERSNEY